MAILDFWVSPKYQKSAEIERKVIKTNKLIQAKNRNVMVEKAIKVRLKG